MSRVRTVGGAGHAGVGVGGVVAAVGAVRTAQRVLRHVVQESVAGSGATQRLRQLLQVVRRLQPRHYPLLRTLQQPQLL